MLNGLAVHRVSSHQHALQAGAEGNRAVSTIHRKRFACPQSGPDGTDLRSLSSSKLNHSSTQHHATRSSGDTPGLGAVRVIRNLRSSKPMPADHCEELRARGHLRPRSLRADSGPVSRIVDALPVCPGSISAATLLRSKPEFRALARPPYPGWRNTMTGESSA